MRERGTFEGLDAVLREEVRTHVVSALETATPTPIPDSSSYPSKIAWEASAFVALARMAERRERVFAPEMVARWLPAVLCAMLNSEWIDVVAQCIRAAPREAEDAAIRAIGRELRLARGYAFTARDLPVEFWSDRFSMNVMDLIGADGDLGSRSALLQIMAQRAPSLIASLAAQWAESHEPKMRGAGMSALLMIDPTRAWPFLLQDVADRKADALRDLSVLFAERGSSVEAPKLSLPQTQELCLLIQRHVPRPEHQDGVVYSAGADDNLYDLQGRMVQDIFARVNEGRNVQCALTTLAAEIPYVARWLAGAEAHEALSQMADAKVPPPLSVEILARALAEAGRQVIGEAADLQALVVDALLRINDGARRDRELVIEDSFEAADAKRPNMPKQRHESILRKYLRTRLHDLLPWCRPEGGFFIDEEPEQVSRTRPDIMVKGYHGKGVEIALELKRSDNKGVWTALEKQLGQLYLRPQGHLTHGVYVVGYLKKPKGKEPQISDAKDMLEALENQANDWNKANPDRPIVPVVIDFSFPAGDTARKRPERGARAGKKPPRGRQRRVRRPL